jgi:RNA polymerase sigma factor (sigma-70 family)
MGNEFDKDYFLWQRFKKGDEDAFFHLYDQHIDLLYRFGSQYTQDKDLIKDCIHDLFLDLYKYREKLSDTNNIRFYLFSALRHKILKEQSKKQLIYWDNIELPVDQPVLPFEDSLIALETEEENFRILNQVLNTLTDRQREALFLKFKYNLTYPEIAKILGITVESARTIIYRSLKELRECLNENNHSIHLLFFLFAASKN